MEKQQDAINTRFLCEDAELGILYILPSQIKYFFIIILVREFEKNSLETFF